MRILIATDNHCGYGEVKKTLYDDAFVTLEEVFQHAKQQDVDFMLLGGDLFHDNNPTRETQLRVMRIFRQYVFKGPSTDLEFASRPEVSFAHSQFKRVNFEDENLGVSLPIFIIHGNHDDLSGTNTSALDVLHEAGLLNLFGRYAEVGRYEVKPMLIRKPLEDGTTENIAIYGISSQRDDRLARAFNFGKVIFSRPPDAEKWFSVLVLHQNRPPRSQLRSTGSYIGANMIPEFFNLVIWGHEHESFTEAEFVCTDPSNPRIRILQPGSTVVTSLTPGEAKPKHCFVLSFHGNSKEPEIEAIPLQTTRQVYVEEANLEHLNFMPPCENTRLPDRMDDERYFHQRVEEILEEAKKKRTERRPPLPLIRIKLNYTGCWRKVPPPNQRALGARYAQRVANPAEMLMIHRQRETLRRPNIETHKGNSFNDGKASNISEHFQNVESDGKMNVLNTESMIKAYTGFINSTEKSTANMEKKFMDAIRTQMDSYQYLLDTLTASANLSPDADGYKDYEERVRQVIYSGERESALTQETMTQYGLTQNSSENGSMDTTPY
ncbi:Double-strand break repair protein MRE11A [Aphelenchoides besseyi]|nr:Double-strand break repair protein MRE11A [Aphelenchoides besseyi]